MTRFVARIVGTLIGSLAGPVGALFGLLVGWLIDQFRADRSPQRRLDRFLTYPGRESDPDRAWTYTVATVAVAVLQADGPARVPQVEWLLSAPWPARPGRRKSLSVANSRSARRSILDAVLVRETDRRVNDVATLQRRADEGARAELVRFLTELAALDTRGVSRAEREVLVELSAALGVSPSVIAATEEEKGGLDRRACRILSVPPTADEAEVRRSFRVLAQQLHPDSGAGLDTGRREAMNDAFTRVRDAYELVLDQLRRREEIKGADLSSSITPKR